MLEVHSNEELYSFTNDVSTQKTQTDAPKPKEINIDELLANQVGACGIWQSLIIFLIVASGPSMAYFPVFVNAVPNLRCRMEPELEKLFKGMNLSFENVSALVGPASGCSRYAYNWTNIKGLHDLTEYPVPENDIQTETCPYGYVYQSSRFQYPSTITAEFDLVCAQTWLAPMGTSLYMFGMFIGYIIGGWLGDKYGRRYTAIGFSLLELCAAAAVSAAPNHHVYHSARTIMAITNTGKASILRILPLEITLAKYRGYFSSLIVLGVLFFHRAAMSGFAYLIPNWRWLHVVVNAPCLFSLWFFCVLPESPRWLNSQNKPAEAVRVLQTGQRYNQLCRRNLNKSAQLELLLSELETAKDLIPVTSKSKRSTSNLFQQLRAKSVGCQQLKALIIGTLLMNTQTLSLFGVILYARVINDYVYIVSLINAFTSIPGPVIASIAYRLYKYRRLPLVICLGITFLSLMFGGLYTFVRKPTTDTVLNICCNCALIMYSANLVMLSTYLAELFPSETRTRAMGLISGFGRLGGTFSTFVNQLDTTVGHGMPVIFYGLASALQFGLLFFLEDTSGENLQDIVTDKKKSPETLPIHEDSRLNVEAV